MDTDIVDAIGFIILVGIAIVLFGSPDGLYVACAVEIVSQIFQIKGILKKMWENRP